MTRKSYSIPNYYFAAAFRHRTAGMPPQAIQRRAYANRKPTKDSLLSAMERVGSEEMGDGQEYAEGEKTIVKGLNGKKGSYDAYLIPDGLDGNFYTKDGKIINGTQYKVKLGVQKGKKQEQTSGKSKIEKAI